MNIEDQQKIGDILKYLSWFCVFLLLPFPVDIYYVTRIILCFGAIYGSLKLYHLNPNSDKIFLLGITAIIFNPLFPFYFQIRSIWMLMDIFAAYAFYVSSKEFIGQALTQETKEPQESKEFIGQAPTQETKEPQESKVFKEIKKSLDNEKRTEDQLELDTTLHRYHVELFIIAICDQIAHVVPRGINKKEQLVLGLFYLYFVIEKLGLNLKPRSYANAGHGFFLNSIFIPKTYFEIEEDIHKISYISEVEKIIAKEARYVEAIPKWLERIKSDGYSAAKIYFSIKEFTNSKYQYIQDFCRDQNTQELNGSKSPLHIIFQDEVYLSSIQKELERVVVQANKNFAQKNLSKDESILDSIINNQNSETFSQKEIKKNDTYEFEKDIEAMTDQEIQDLINEMNLEDDEDQGLNNKTSDPKGAQDSFNFSDTNKVTSKLEDALEYFFAFSLYLLKTEANGLKLSESKKLDFRSKYIVDNKIINHGVWFFSRIELESSNFTNHHVSKNSTDKIFKRYDEVNNEIRTYLKTII